MPTKLPLAVNADSVERRREALDEMIDNRIMTQKARAAGVEKDPLYLARYDEFRKTRLINMHRGKLVHGMDPTDAEVQAYYEKNRDAIRIRRSGVSLGPQPFRVAP